MNNAIMIGKLAKMEYVLTDVPNGTAPTVNMVNATMFLPMESAELIQIVHNKIAHV